MLKENEKNYFLVIVTWLDFEWLIPAGNYMFKINNKNTRKRCETVNFEHISHLFLVFLLLTLSMQMLAGID